MKTLKFGDKIIYAVNVLAAFLLLIAYVSPYLPPQRFAFLSVLSLSVPLLIALNIVFCIYWLLRIKKQVLLSLVILCFGYRYINSMYKFSETKTVEDSENMSIMNYNVRLFNLFDWLPSKTVKTDILKFIAVEQPDILCLQEYCQSKAFELKDYFKYESLSSGKIKSGLVIFTKYPIINSGSVKFPDTHNNAIFADIIKGNDTIRVYNIHLQSSGINTEISSLKKENSNDLFKQVSKTFKLQQIQADLFLEHKSKCHYKTIISGDFNNTAYSYVYKKIKYNYIDTFEEAGYGFGRTYDFKFFPIRIDFILVDNAFVVNGFKTYDIKLSDHFPIKATLKL